MLEVKYIYQELAVTSGHTKSFFSKMFGRFLNTAIMGQCTLYIYYVSKTAIVNKVAFRSRTNGSE